MYGQNNIAAASPDLGKACNLGIIVVVEKVFSPGYIPPIYTAADKDLAKGLIERSGQCTLRTRALCAMEGWVRRCNRAKGARVIGRSARQRRRR